MDADVWRYVGGAGVRGGEKRGRHQRHTRSAPDCDKASGSLNVPYGAAPGAADARAGEKPQFVPRNTQTKLESWWGGVRGEGLGPKTL